MKQFRLHGRYCSAFLGWLYMDSWRWIIGRVMYAYHCYVSATFDCAVFRRISSSHKDRDTPNCYSNHDFIHSRLNLLSQASGIPLNYTSPYLL